MPIKKPTTKKKTASKKAPIDNATVVAEYFGFGSTEIPHITKEAKKKVHVIQKGSNFHHPILPSLEEVAALLSDKEVQIQKRSPNDPLMVYYNTKTSPKSKSQKPEKIFSLNILGNNKTISEAILIKTAASILEEDGYKNLAVEINYIGGKEAMGKLFKEITSYYRKHISDLNSNCRQLFKDSIHSLSLEASEIKEELVENSPSPLSFLTDVNRESFKEIIEYLETQGIPYVINKNILGNPHYSSHSVFTIIDKNTDKILAAGSRFNQIAKKIGTKKEISAACVVIKRIKPKKVPAVRLPKKETTKYFFMQIGPQAKMKSLKVIDGLRKAGIAVRSSLCRDKLSTQLQYAQRVKTPFLLIMGQKEAIDNAVVVRDTLTHKQTSVSIDTLPKYLNDLK